MVKPKVVFISNSTEVGTHYTRSEIVKLSEFCKENGLYLYLDGARLASGLMVEGSDLNLKDISELVDMFYIGGTKNGALLGEAIVVNNEALKSDFIRNIKQKGGLLAKGRVLGIQFDVLFKDDLYFQLGREANQMASRLVRGLENLGVDFLTDSKSNQIFPIFTDDVIDELSKQYGFYIWSKVDDTRSSIRLVTSWATEEEMVDEFLEDARRLL